MRLKEAQSLWLRQNKAFVSFRLPADEDVTTYAGGSFCVERPENSRPYFVLTPFDVRKHPQLFLSPEAIIRGEEIPEFTLGKSNPAFRLLVPSLTSKEEYLKQAANLIALMQQQQYRKVVLSRIVAQPFAAHQLPELFEQLCFRYPNAFVFLLSDGHGLLWAGASPETLLHYAHRKAQTVALAATQKLDGRELSQLVWSRKETEEQAMVTEYIRRMLALHRARNLEVVGPVSAAAGHLAHLMTSFSWESTFAEALALANDLHPTPAVCGLPRPEAMRLIGLTEQHDRSFYTGCLGYVKPDEEIRLYVNLRCMQGINNEAFLYVGGGLTVLSDPVDEWDETQAKAETLLAVFPK